MGMRINPAGKETASGHIDDFIAGCFHAEAQPVDDRSVDTQILSFDRIGIDDSSTLQNNTHIFTSRIGLPAPDNG